MRDNDAAYAFKDATITGLFQYELFGQDDFSLGYQTLEYVTTHQIPVREDSPRQLWWTSDPHYGHANIIKYCARPFESVEVMDKELIARWNGRVAVKDTVIVVGDFSFSSEERTTSILSELHGTKILIRGNHDNRKTDTYWRRVGFAAVVTDQTIDLVRVGKVYVKHEPVRYGGYGENTPTVQVCGHVHEKWATKYYSSTRQLYINVGVDQHRYAPISTSELVTIIEEQWRLYRSLNSQGTIRAHRRATAC